MDFIHCPECKNEVSPDVAMCPICGHIFPAPKPVNKPGVGKPLSKGLVVLPVLLTFLGTILYYYHMCGHFYSPLWSTFFSKVSTYCSLISALCIPVVCLISVKTDNKQLAQKMVAITLTITILQFIYSIANYFLSSYGVPYQYYRLFDILFNGKLGNLLFAFQVGKLYSNAIVPTLSALCFFAKNLLSLSIFKRIANL